MSYFRIKETTSPVTVLRQGSLLGIDIGDFIYPEELETLVCSASVTYYNDRTGEHFTWTPGDTAPVSSNAVVTPAVETPVVETTEEVASSDAETGSKNTKT
jgi:hypothetical protein